MIQIIPLQKFPLIKKGDNIGKMIMEYYKKNTLEIKEEDIIIIAQTIISKAEGAIIKLDSLEPSAFAIEIAKRSKKDPKHIEVILREAKNIWKNRNGVLITETKHGFVCANSGVDRSNVPGENIVTLLPKDPDKSAKMIRKIVEKESGKNIAIIISDTHNRPFRLGAINIAIGCSGINPLFNYAGKKDLYGHELKSSTTSLADQLCSAAGLQMGEADDGYPIIIIRGVKFDRKEISAKNLIRPEERDYFR